MIYLEENGLLELDAKTSKLLLNLLDMPSDVSLESFISDEYHSLYEFLYEILGSPSDESYRCIILDWRWGVDDLIEKMRNMKHLFPSFQWRANYAAAPDTQEGSFQPNVQTISFKLPEWGSWQSIDFSLDDSPDKLFDELNKYLEATQFISINLGDDAYYYLAAPKDINIDKLCSAVGLRIQQTPRQNLEKAPQITLNDIDTVQKAKIFFTPIHDNHHRTFNWSGRVLPGQTIKEGIARELREMEHYGAPFTIKNVSFKDFGIDKQGNHIPRYWVTLVLE